MLPRSPAQLGENRGAGGRGREIFFPCITSSTIGRARTFTLGNCAEKRVRYSLIVRTTSEVGRASPPPEPFNCFRIASYDEAIVITEYFGFMNTIL